MQTLSLPTLLMTSFFVKPSFLDKEMFLSKKSISNTEAYRRLLDKMKNRDALAKVLCDKEYVNILDLSNEIGLLCKRKAKVNPFSCSLDVEDINLILSMLALVPFPSFESKDKYLESIKGGIVRKCENYRVIMKHILLNDDLLKKSRFGFNLIKAKLIQRAAISTNQLHTPDAKIGEKLGEMFYIPETDVGTNMEIENALDDLLTRVVFTYCLMKKENASIQNYFDLASSSTRRCLAIMLQYEKSRKRLQELVVQKTTLAEQIKKNADPNAELKRVQETWDGLGFEIERYMKILESQWFEFNGIYTTYAENYATSPILDQSYEFFERDIQILRNAITTWNVGVVSAMTGLGALVVGNIPSFDFWADFDRSMSELLGLEQKLIEHTLPSTLKIEIEKELQDLKTNPTEMPNAGVCTENLLTPEEMLLKNFLVGTIGVFSMSLVYGLVKRNRKKLH